MLDWFQFNGFSSFIYIIVLLLVFKLLGTMLGQRLENQEQNNLDCDDPPNDPSDACDTGYASDTCDIPDNSDSDSSGDIILEIRKDDMYNMIMAIRKLQYRMRDI